MSDQTTQKKLPVGAATYKRIPDDEMSFELAEQLARRGASESLIRAVGGEEAVKKLMHAARPVGEH
jgi:hypothetical protein